MVEPPGVTVSGTHGHVPWCSAETKRNWRAGAQRRQRNDAAPGRLGLASAPSLSLGPGVWIPSESKSGTLPPAASGAPSGT